MLEIQKYIRQNNRTLRKNYRKTLITPLLHKIHYLQNLQKMILNYLKNHFLNKKAFFLYSLVLFYFFVFRDFAWAETTPVTKTSETVNGAIDILNGILGLISFITQPLIMFVGWLLSPDWTFGDVFNLRPVMHSIWVMVSNFVYIIFAFVLVAIAFMNIFGESKNYAIKTSLPKLVVAILIVPFTWFIVSAVLSISSILTASVISLSYDSITRYGNDQNMITDKKVIPGKIVIDLTENSDYQTDYDKNGTASSVNKEDYAKAQKAAKEKYINHYGLKTPDCSKDDKGCITLNDVFSDAKGAYNLLPYYAYNIFKIDKMKVLGEESFQSTIKTVGDVFKKLTFSLIFILIFSILVIAIAYALVSRMFMLWLFAMFSPLFALSYFLGGKGGKLEEKLKKHMTIQKFISLAMVPVYVSAALSFGLVFLSFAMNKNNFTQDKGNSSYVSLDPANKRGDQTMTFGKNMSLIIVGNYTESSGIAGDLFDTGAGFISNIIVSFLALIILWMAVMAALSADDITGNAVKPISDFGASIGKLALESPKYIPIKIPGTKGKGPDGKSLSMPLAGLSSMGAQISSSITNAAQAQGTQFGSDIGKSVAEKFGLKMDEGIDKVNNYINQNDISKLSTQASVGNDLDKVLTLMGKNLDEFSSNKVATDLFASRISKINNGVIPEKNRKEIVELFEKGGKSSVLEGMKKLEHALGADNIGGEGIDLGDVDGTEKYFKSKKDGQEISAKGNSLISLNLKDYTKGNKINVEIPGKDGKMESKTISLSSNLSNKKEITEELKGVLKDSNKYDIEKLADEIISKNTDTKA